MMDKMADGDEPTETTTLSLGDGEGDDGDLGAQVPMVSVTNLQSMPLTGHHHRGARRVLDHGRPAGEAGSGAGGVLLGEADESHPHLGDNLHVDYVVVVRLDDSYLKTLAGLIRFLQVVFSVIGLICLTSSGVNETSYLLLPLAWHLRTFVFVSVSGLMMSSVLITIQVTGLIAMLPINWALFDVITYSVLSFLYLFGTSLVASAIDYYQKLDGNVTQWTIEQLIVSVVLGYMCLFLYGATAVMGYRRWRGSGQFRRYRLKNSTSSRGTRSSVA